MKTNTTKKGIVIGLFGAAVGALLLLTQIGWIDRPTLPLKFEGAWIARMPDTGVVWTYTYAHSDTTGSTAAIQGSFSAGIDPTLGGRFPEAKSFTPIVGEAVLTGPMSGSQTFMCHAVKTGDGAPQIAYTLVGFGTIQKADAGMLKARYHFHVYTPEQLAATGGVPSQTAEPTLCMCGEATHARIPVLRSFTKNCGE